MKISKKLEAEILQVMNEYWSSYLCGDFDTWASYLPDNYGNIGTTKEEVWKSKKEIMDYTGRISDQITGTIELRDKRTQFIPYDPYIMVHELGDMYVEAEEGWIYYAPFRLSSLLNKTNNGWKILHQHGSFPDSKADEGEAFGINELKIENKKLRDAIQSRTIELERNNRELEIEAALERVRARTMAMQNSEELPEAANLLFQQVQALGIPVWSTAFNIFCDDKSRVLCNVSSEGKLQPSFTIPLTEEKSFREWNKALERKDAFFVQELKDKDLEQHYEYLFTLSGVKDAVKPLEEEGIALPTYQVNHIYPFEHGFLLFITHEKVPEAYPVFRRFTSVFEQTYTRFLDLQKAEAQTREAQIEASLERVRARSMAMHRSDELGEVAKVMFDQMKLLGGELFAFGIVLCDKDENMVEQWHSLGEAGMMSPFKVPIDLDYIHRYRYDQWQAGVELFSIEIPADYIARHFELMFELPSVQTVKEDLAAKGIEIKAPPWEIDYGASFNHGYLLISSLQPFKEDHIFPRFAKVFEQAYTRFLDLQKAEAQARDAQIEASLERVRARSMAMHDSEELKEVIQVLYDQFVQLEIFIEHSGFIIDYKNRDDMLIWLADKNAVFPQISIPYFDSPHWNSFIDAKKSGSQFFANKLDFEEKNKFYNQLFTYIPNLTDEVKDHYLKCEGLAISTVLMDNVGLYIENFSGTPYTDEENDILMRFGKVFQQTYTRFLDLQKAEAQAREAQIQLGLERVRSRAMAMQNSDELDEVLSVLCEQFDVLEIFPMSTHMTVFDFENNTFTFRETGKYGNRSFGEQTVALDAMETWKDTVDSWREQNATDINRLHFPKESLSQVWEVFHESFASMPEESRITADDYPDGLYHTAGKHPYGYIGMNQTRLATEEEEAIVLKFAKEFGSAYTRFLDLQKAEAQAREAQIEAALEKVRSRSLAVKKSDEFNEVVGVVFEKLSELDIPIDSVTIALTIKGTKDLDVYGCGEGDSGLSLIKFTLPYFSNAFSDDILAAQSSVISGYFSKIYSEEEKNQYYEFAFKNTELKNLPDDLKERVWQSKSYALSVAHTKNSSIMVNEFDGNVLGDDQADILKRFSRVFDQAYTRFLDLQKAEARTREAQIEAALERTRNQSMLMQHSEELNKVSNAFHEQLLQLGLSTVFSYVWLPDEENQTHMFWATWSENNNGTSISRTKAITNPLDKTDAYTAACFEMWESGHSVFVNRILPEEVEEFFTSWSELLGDAKHMKPELFEEGLYYAEAYMKYGCFGINIRRSLTEEEQQVLHRFSIEFERAYTRFRDLQKAEAQAREAQIEASLERVRAQTMAMHNSEDVGKCIVKMFGELTALGVDEGTRFGIGILNDDNENNQLWTASKDGEEVKMNIGELDMTLHPLLKSARKAWKKQVPLHKYVLEGKDLLNYYHMLNNAPDYKIRIAIEEVPDKEFHYGFIFDHGFFYAFSPCEFQQDLIHITQRFSSLFGQTYQRYLDLVKAETQAREAQIEASLERVRATSMAMHKSEELADLSLELVAQVQKLGIETWFCAFNITDDDEKGSLEWGSNGQGVFPKYRTPREGIFLEYYEAGQRGETLFVKEIGENQCPAHYEYLCSLPGVGEQLLKMKAEGISFPSSQIDHVAFFKYGYILFITFDPVPEAHDIFKRFAKVFEQTYTRFLDLQKAEAQAWEARIEASLEKVRSRTMAMQHSDELPEAANLLFKEVQSLGIPAWSAGYCIWENEDKKSSTAFMSSEGVLQKPFSLPTKGVGYDFYNPLQNEETFHIEELGGEELVKHYEFMRTLPIFGEVIDGIMEAGFPLPTFQIFHILYFPQGYLMFITYEQVAHAHDIFKRFAKVFEQTYTRFLDLQKAEAQAREAQIEGALEKVRSRTMGMHKANELHEVVTVVVERLMDLGVILDANGAILCTYFEDSKDVLHWVASPDFSFAGSYLLPYFDHPIFSAAWESKISGADYFSKAFTVEEKNSFYEYAFEHSDYKNFPDEFKEWVFQNDKHSLSFAWSENSAILIPSHTGILPSVEDVEVLKRFAQVFEQAYVRFMDLQRAEAQAREVQIELSLERIRAEAMAMKEPEDLLDIVVKMRKEFIALGHEAHYFWHMKWESEKYLKAMTSGDGTRIGTVMELPRNMHGELPNLAEWEKGKDPTVIHVMDIEATLDYIHKMVEWGDFKQVDPNMPTEDDIRHIGGLTYVMARTLHGEIGYSLPGMVPDPSEEAVNILIRFADTFDLAYRRFEDLQKAKDQASKIKLVNEENERLLHSILPEQIVEQIKTDRKSVVKRFEHVSILFADIVGFTVLSEKLNPGKVVDILNGLFSKFDDLTDIYHLEKIKTIGDAYMVASGVPEENEKHVHNIFHFAQKMLEATKNYNRDNDLELQLRIGISSGPVVAGVIGKKKFSYDLWGDSVNTAARMEAYGQTGKIQIAPASYELLKNDFLFEKIPGVMIKGKGEMDVYLWNPSQ